MYEEILRVTEKLLALGLPSFDTVIHNRKSFMCVWSKYSNYMVKLLRCVCPSAFLSFTAFYCTSCSLLNFSFFYLYCLSVCLSLCLWAMMMMMMINGLSSLHELKDGKWIRVRRSLLVTCSLSLYVIGYFPPNNSNKVAITKQCCIHRRLLTVHGDGAYVWSCFHSQISTAWPT